MTFLRCSWLTNGSVLVRLRSELHVLQVWEVSEVRRAQKDLRRKVDEQTVAHAGVWEHTEQIQSNCSHRKQRWGGVTHRRDDLTRLCLVIGHRKVKACPNSSECKSTDSDDEDLMCSDFYENKVYLNIFLKM